MTGRLTILASGSSGNAALLEVNGFGLLIDCGLHPRFLSGRLAAVGASWETVDAAILTHTHGDHWKDLCLAHFRSHGIPLYAHPEHLRFLNGVAPSFGPLHTGLLTRTYARNRLLELTPGLTCLPVRASHDSDPTFAFRLDFADADGPAWSAAYASDMGCWSGEQVEAFAGVDVLAVEYNHDEQMERNSTRPAFLVQRVLGDNGHLSNRQAADFTRAVVGQSAKGSLTHLVQLHLSKDCNHPNLAESAGRNALADTNPAASVITARQDVPAKSVPLGRRPGVTRRPAPKLVAVSAPEFALPQPCLPGFDGR